VVLGCVASAFRAIPPSGVCYEGPIRPHHAARHAKEGMNSPTKGFCRQPTSIEAAASQALDCFSGVGRLAGHQSVASHGRASLD
jgi:hypothetical protein